MLIHFEDEHIIVVQKPPKMPCQNDPSGDESLASWLENYIISSDTTNQNPFLGVVHRLDRPVGGLIVFAKSKKGAQGLSKLIQTRAFHKTYLCVVDGKPTPADGNLCHHLKKKAGQNISLVVHKNNKGAKEARLSYMTLETLHDFENDLSLMQIQLETGRHHQIRVQMAEAGYPLWGDTKYNAQFMRKRGWSQIALWSHMLSFVHPITGKQLSFVDWPEDEYPWNQFQTLKDKLHI